MLSSMVAIFSSSSSSSCETSNFVEVRHNPVCFSVLFLKRDFGEVVLKVKPSGKPTNICPHGFIFCNLHTSYKNGGNDFELGLLGWEHIWLGKRLMQTQRSEHLAWDCGKGGHFWSRQSWQHLFKCSALQQWPGSGSVCDHGISRARTAKILISGPNSSLWIASCCWSRPRWESSSQVLLPFGVLTESKTSLSAVTGPGRWFKAALRTGKIHFICLLFAQW